MKKVFVVESYNDLSDVLAIYGERELFDSAWTFLVLEQSGNCKTSYKGKIISLADYFGFAPVFMPQKSYCVLQFLKEEPTLTVIIYQNAALGFYSLLHREQRSYLKGTTFGLSSPRPFLKDLENQQKFPAGRTDIELNAMEQECFKLYDGLLSIEAGDFFEMHKPCTKKPVAIFDGLKAFVDNATPRKRNSDGINDKTTVEEPFISVCIPTHNRPGYLSQALKSLSAQSYKKFEVIVVDDGSDLKHKAELTSLEKQYETIGWRFLSQENAGPAAARNYAGFHAKGAYLLFMDDDDIALSNELEIFAKAAQKTNADIFTCIPGLHPNSIARSEIDIEIKTGDSVYPLIKPDFLPLGGFIELGVFINCFGCNNALFKKDVFDELGGYLTEKELLLEDVELFTRALAKGFNLKVIPEILFLYRKHDNSRSWNEYTYQSHLRSLEPYKGLIDERLWPLLIAHRKGFYERHVSIASDVTEAGIVSAGKWVTLSQPDGKEFELRVKVENPGKHHSLLMDVKGDGKLSFRIASKEYEMQCNSKSSFICEHDILPGSIQNSGDLVINFSLIGELSVRRIAVLKQ
ncbi:glycosyltransferase family 2 protein [Kiloniella litopenaei]|uniref:glycosyltransferase family 2 protein n=1 Tax=Kiloniella litopenaei TaxID=1549748 RepID=UPI003BA927EC